MSCSKYSSQELDQCRTKVERLIDTLYEFARDLDEYKLNANFGKAVGGGTATVGSALVIGGAIASFLTMGAASILVPVGLLIGAAGGITVTGASIIELIFKKDKLQEAQKLWDRVLNDPVMSELLRQFDDPDDGVQGRVVAAGATRGMKSGLQIGAAVAQTAGKTAMEVAGVSLRGLAVAGAAFEAVLLPLSLYDLINSSIEVHKKTKCSAGEELRKVAKMFAEVRDKLRERLRELQANGNATR